MKTSRDENVTNGTVVHRGCHRAQTAARELPETLAGLPRLRQLDVRSNRLTRLPDWVVDMPALEKLDVRWNACEPSPSLLTELERRGCVVLL